jgi:hypothetical protein
VPIEKHTSAEEFNNDDKHSLNITECKICCSGFRVDPLNGENFCGFCGGRLKKITLEMEDDISKAPMYIDSTGGIRIKIEVQNDGMMDIENLRDIKIY